MNDVNENIELTNAEKVANAWTIGAPLSDNDKAKVEEWYAKCSKNEKISSFVDLYGGDIHRLDWREREDTGELWLDDSVLNYFFALLFGKWEADARRIKATYMPSYFMESLLNPEFGYELAKNWIPDIFVFNKILLPMIMGKHWKLAVIDFEIKGITMYDPLGQRDMDTMKTISMFIQAKYEDKMSTPMVEMKDWTIEYPSKNPRQRNGYDCGVFVCAYAADILMQAEFSFEQKDMPNIRQRIIYEIFSNLSPEDAAVKKSV